MKINNISGKYTCIAVSYMYRRFYLPYQRKDQQPVALSTASSWRAVGGMGITSQNLCRRSCSPVKYRRQFPHYAAINLMQWRWMLIKMLLKRKQLCPRSFTIQAAKQITSCLVQITHKPHFDIVRDISLSPIQRCRRYSCYRKSITCSRMEFISAPCTRPSSVLEFWAQRDTPRTSF